ncbi:hypothetical protein HPP92_027679 [Vanilla planifolia]|uniref:Uncharacterized protein n=1 Tax=Vanilla planifolia TaxID=51239 RepID=A0A835U792_VANPL|nr:hypothetical protein HPP92_027679 [Vanilla planifolia]
MQASGGAESRGQRGEGSGDEERTLWRREEVRLRNVVKRQRKEFRSRMVEVEREESEQKRVADERANTRKNTNVNEDFKRKLEEEVCGCERALLESMGPAVAIGPEANINNF